MIYALFKDGNPWKLVIYCKGATNSPGIYLFIYLFLGTSSISWERDSGIPVRQGRELTPDARTDTSPHLRKSRFCLLSVCTVVRTEDAFPLCVF